MKRHEAETKSFLKKFDLEEVEVAAENAGEGECFRKETT